jgi:hypothetical protein
VLCATVLVALFLILLSPCSSGLFAQLTSARVSGRVTYSTQLSIPGAIVTAIDSMTGTTYHVETDNQGTYVLTGPLPDTYRLTFTKSGFQTGIQEGLIVTVGQSATVDTVLQVGSVSTSVTVQAASDAINMQSPTVSTVIDNKMTQELPLNGRDVLQLAQEAIPLLSTASPLSHLLNALHGQRQSSAQNLRPGSRISLATAACELWKRFRTAPSRATSSDSESFIPFYSPATGPTVKSDSCRYRLQRSGF